uniref:EF-hand domain-containing protein n=1 Tax=Craspedostauros australis TaxID=1486917 RepID=A0A7R9ZNJ3_9STRA|mmetsp:Transcript_24294/g.67684  ORF Transcript_24294/g.67684 Transcript_24294/m.67684 type:complete len:108 (+) Transcript_24294:211-534(+)
MPDPQEEPVDSTKAVKAIFEDATEEFAEQFKDKVRALHEHFDKDKDGFLNLKELAALQLATDGSRLTEQNYLMACKALACDPNNGIPLPALKVTYLAEGANIGTLGA